jgi:trans-2,3-dihydro-3-hydroxyanthranilate isomerase
VIDIDLEAGAAAGTHEYYVLDVFTDTALSGNQLAVFTDGSAFDSGTMQRLASELALSETVFLLPAEAGGDARIRIFTPAVELPFAGHPTLGTAVLLASAGGHERVVLETASGNVPVDLVRSTEAPLFGWMEQPIPTFQSYGEDAELLAALGVGGSTLPIDAYTNGPVEVIVTLASEEAVASLHPNQQLLAALGTMLVSCVAGSGRRWKTRMFAPALGVPEDPATGGAAGPIALHLARYGRIEFGEEIEIRQGVEIGRPSVLHARVDGAAEQVQRVAVGGAAVIVARGRFRL